MELVGLVDRSHLQSVGEHVSVHLEVTVDGDDLFGGRGERHRL